MEFEIIKVGDRVNHPSDKIRVIGSSVLVALQKKQVSFTAAHITDIHLKTGNAICAARMPIFKTSLAAQRFDYILNTGDTADSPAASVADVQAFVADMNAIKPMIVARGNHDYGHTNSQLGMPVDNYYYTDIANTKWRIIVLYSQGGGNYSLGATQLNWLADLLLNSKDRHVCIMTHVPITGVAGMMWYAFGKNPVLESTWNLTIDQHSDISALVELFRVSPWVKAALSGHQHIYDDTMYHGVRYLCGGSICANWWQDSSYQEKNNYAGYRLIRFYDDGTVRYEPVYY